MSNDALEPPEFSFSGLRVLRYPQHRSGWQIERSQNVHRVSAKAIDIGAPASPDIQGEVKARALEMANQVADAARVHVYEWMR